MLPGGTIQGVDSPSQSEQTTEMDETNTAVKEGWEFIVCDVSMWIDMRCHQFLEEIW